MNRIKLSFKNMALMVFLMLVAALIFSAVIFYCDRSQFTSIPDAIWWAIVTMTTVGYGDTIKAMFLKLALTE
jgi:voltage-gated potassium channel Kch